MGSLVKAYNSITFGTYQGTRAGDLTRIPGRAFFNFMLELEHFLTGVVSYPLQGFYQPIFDLVNIKT